jgi:hypothetical protein
MIRRLGFEGELIQAHISAYERLHENRVPPLGVVLQYARCAGVEMEVLVDDSLDLPERLTMGFKSGRIKRIPTSKSASSESSKKVAERKRK